MMLSPEPVIDGSPLVERCGRRAGNRNTCNVANARAVVNVAIQYMPAPISKPIAATSQMLAAVVSPRTVDVVRKIVPAPRKPMPETT